MLNRIIVSLGSNKDAERNIAEANRLLAGSYHSIRFSEPVYTRAVGDCFSGFFLNQIAIADVPDRQEEVICRFKQIEAALKRTPEQKAAGIVPIDIDLLQWNDCVLKPDDLARDYVINGIRSLSRIQHK